MCLTFNHLYESCSRSSYQAKHRAGTHGVSLHRALSEELRIRAAAAKPRARMLARPWNDNPVIYRMVFNDKKLLHLSYSSTESLVQEIFGMSNKLGSI